MHVLSRELYDNYCSGHISDSKVLLVHSYCIAIEVLQESSNIPKVQLCMARIRISRAALQQHTSICGGALPLGSTSEGNSIPAIKKIYCSTAIRKGTYEFYDRLILIHMQGFI